VGAENSSTLQKAINITTSFIYTQRLTIICNYNEEEEEEEGGQTKKSYR
jgi:hypothetical protein